MRRSRCYFKVGVATHIRCFNAWSLDNAWSLAKPPLSISDDQVVTLLLICGHSLFVCLVPCFNSGDLDLDPKLKVRQWTKKLSNFQIPLCNFFMQLSSTVIPDHFVGYPIDHYFLFCIVVVLEVPPPRCLLTVKSNYRPSKRCLHGKVENAGIDCSTDSKHAWR